MSTTLSNKAKRFIAFRGKGGTLTNKATIIGEQTFPEILPFLANGRIREELEIEEPGEITPHLKGVLEYAELIGVTEEFITSLYREYLKSYLN